MKRLFPVYVVSCLIASHSFAGSATWSANPVSDDWYTPENWVPETVPNGPNDVATIGPSTITTIVLPEQSVTVLDSVIFQTFAHLTVSNGASLTFEGAGALRSENAAITSKPGSTIVFRNDSICDAGPTVQGQITFQDQSMLINELTVNEGGMVFFSDQSFLGSYQANVYAGTIYFNDDSTVLVDNLYLLSPGIIDISGHNRPGIGFEWLGQGGGGVVKLGRNDLTVTRDFYKKTNVLIQDGGLYAGNKGSLTKVGAPTDTLSLVTPNTYSGGTVIEGGTLLAGNKSGSATGSGPVQVNGGALGGTGTIVGSVTIGSGTGNTATLFGGSEPPRGGKFTLKRSLTFASDGLYLVKIDGLESRSTSVSAREVIIHQNARIKITTQRGGTMTDGTTLTLIENTGESAIEGTFKKLPDGGKVTVGSNTFQVSYSGGDGNDLTLTVVP